MFSDILKTLRTNRHYSQAKLAEILDVSQQAVGLWERDKNMPDTNMLVKIAKLFLVSTDYLLELEPPHISNNYSNSRIEAIRRQLSEAAVEIGRKYDCVDKRGQGNIKSVVEREYEMTIEAQTEDVGASL